MKSACMSRPLAMSSSHEMLRSMRRSRTRSSSRKGDAIILWGAPQRASDSLAYVALPQLCPRSVERGRGRHRWHCSQAAARSQLRPGSWCAVRAEAQQWAQPLASARPLVPTPSPRRERPPKGGRGRGARTPPRGRPRGAPTQPRTRMRVKSARATCGERWLPVWLAAGCMDAGMDGWPSCSIHDWHGSGAAQDAPLTTCTQ
eukprot:scaffold7335_cov417-Prasinococcus_capsulatus_cf.AAC.16